jgi:tetratricopeptide (TPR) repeat protein
VSDERQIAALIDQADRSRSAHDWDGAMTLLKRALSIDPEHAVAHASLALALLGARRLNGAAIEADLALAFDGNNPFCHYAAACVRTAERKLGDAWGHIMVALEEEADADTHVLAAEIKNLEGDRAAARSHLRDALAHDANHVEARTDLARIDLAEGKIDEAHAHIEYALAADPGAVDAHVVAGHVALHRGDTDDAEEHARFALAQDAGDRGALHLWTAIKAHRSVWLGLWWKFSSFTSLRSERGQLAILIGSFVAMRLLIILVGAAGFEDLEVWLGRIWLGFCAYTWFAPEIFKWMLSRELQTVVLDDDY